jgi:serine/threonine-protein kinase
MADDLRERLQSSLGDAYSIERELGGGGMARVFLATDRTLSRSVVVKVLPPETAAGVSIDRFKREIAVAAQMTHPHIVPLFTAGDANGLPWYTMPYVDGQALRDRLTREGELPVAECVRLLRDVAMALVHAHERGVVHRDIKPENVLLTGGSAMVTDFGVAKALSASADDPIASTTSIGMALGTPAYMSPEQATASTVMDHRSDIYALGVLGYELLTGRTPFAGRTGPQTLAAQVTETPLPVAKVRATTPPALAALVMRCLEKSPADRPQSALEILHELDHIATPSGGMQPAAAPSSAWRTRALVAAGIVVVLAGGAWMLTRPKTPNASVLDPHRVVIASFENRTGDASLDAVGAMAADWIARGLTGAEILEVSGTSEEISSRTGEKLLVGAGNLDSLAHFTRAGLVVSGAYYRRGDSLLLQADITNATTRNRLQSIGPIAALATAPDAGVEEIRVRVTGALATLVDSTLAGVGSQLSKPPSVDAYREYLSGEAEFYRNKKLAADRLLAAYRRDTTFNFSLIRAANAYKCSVSDKTSDSLMAIISTKREQLSALERAYADWVHAYCEGAREAELLAATRAMVAAAPRSPWARYALAQGLLFGPDRRQREALGVLESLDPEGGGVRGRADYFAMLIAVLHDIGDTSRAMREAEKGFRLYGKSHRVDALSWLMETYAAAGRTSAVDSLIPELLAAPLGQVRPINVLSNVALEMRAHGHAAAAGKVESTLGVLVEQQAAEAGAQSFHGAFLLTQYFVVLGRWNDASRYAEIVRGRASTDMERIDAIGLSGFVQAHTDRRAEALRANASIDSMVEHAPTRDRERYAVYALYWPIPLSAALGNRDLAVQHVRRLLENRHATGMFHTDPLIIDLFGYAPFQDEVRPKN